VKRNHSNATKKGWITRRANARKRSQSARKGWRTRRHNELSRIAKKGWHTRRKTERARKQQTGGDFCKLENREAFVKQVIEDRKKFRDKLGEEAGSDFQLWFQVGTGEKRNRKEKKNLQYTHGLRKFTSLQKMKIFLAIEARHYERPLPKWDRRKNGLCTFEKRAWLVQRRHRGQRALKPKILKRYYIQQVQGNYGNDVDL
jgi:hypothetical protein